MKKILALMLAALLIMSISAFGLAEEEAGFDEYELGVEGEQEVGFMTMAMVYFQPVDMAPT
ncbi:MAG: iron transporter, partial [Clostridia bacterium]|nr:iron transporter [Clostridia bacterium]